ncbi:CoxE Protein containing von Willebrand factor type A (vWA) domain [Comamonadaceae bacterium]
MSATAQADATDPRQQVGEFAHYLREHGFSLGYAEVELMVQSAATLPLQQWERIAALWRGIASGSHTQWSRYPEVHQAYWFPHKVKGKTLNSGLTQRSRSLPDLVKQMHSEMGDSPPGASKPTLGVTDAPGVGDIDAPGSPKRAQGGASRTAPQDERDFSEWLPGDMDRFEPLVEAFKRQLRTKLMRRFQGHPDHGAIHLRRSLRHALATGGELVKLHHIKRKRRMPQVVVLVDVSRSMETHAQFYLRLSRALVEIMDARAFVFHTRLAEVTPLMRQRSKRIQEKVNAVSFGFGGGTRIAHCLNEALDVHLGRGLKRGDLFMVLSDGYDTDEPQGLSDVLARVQGRGARVCWLHPTVDMPQSAAMVLAAQHVTRFMPVHNLASLSRLPELLV